MSLRLRLRLLRAVLVAGDRIGRRLPPARPRRQAPTRPGLSVLVPESGTPTILDGTLAALADARTGIDEPVHVRVLVNGASPARYADLRRRFADVEWRFVPTALGFHGAVRAGLAGLPHDWVYLLNSDMRLAPDALRALLPLRSDDVFAIASRIHVDDPRLAGEETGLTGWSAEAAWPSPLDLVADGDAVVEHLYAGGGASLFRTADLREAVAATPCYAPFYFEDTDWGVRAWRQGRRVLFCPASRARHLHRATISRVDPAEVERIRRRNLLWLEARHAVCDTGTRTLAIAIAALDDRSRRELTAWHHLPALLRSRIAARRCALPAALAPIPATRPSWRPAVPARRPRLLWVTPFSIVPQSHGGARRSFELLHALSAHFEIVLLSDEATAYPADWEHALAFCHAVKLVGGRPPEDASIPCARARRRHAHAHAGLRQALDDLIRHFEPALVHVEHAELIDLVRQRSGRTPWVLSLHDVLFGDDAAADADESAALARYALVIACSDEDRARVPHPHCIRIDNGSAVVPVAHVPSPAQGPLLFVGAFRHPPNRVGLQRFLADGWPRLRAAFPWLRLRVIGGDGARRLAVAEPGFDDPRIEVVDRVEDLASAYREAALCLNPQIAIRGSALKVIEARCAGRVIVCTDAGARGFGAIGGPGLRRVPAVEHLAAEIAALLTDVRTRHRIEAAEPALHAWTWPAIAERMRHALAALATVDDHYTVTAATP